MPDVEVNENGLNANIKAHILPDEKMHHLGFSDRNKDAWYFEEYWDDIEISFNVRIPKGNSEKLEIDILDENFLQPYDYQYLLSRDSNFKIAKMVKLRVDKCMERLVESSVLSGWKVGDYV